MHYNKMFDDVYQDEVLSAATHKKVADIVHIHLTKEGERACNAMHELQLRHYTDNHFEICVGNADFAGGLGGYYVLAECNGECTIDEATTVYGVVGAAVEDMPEYGEEFAKNLPLIVPCNNAKFKSDIIPEPVADSEATSDGVDNEYEG